MQSRTATRALFPTFRWWMAGVWRCKAAEGPSRIPSHRPATRKSLSASESLPLLRFLERQLREQRSTETGRLAAAAVAAGCRQLAAALACSTTAAGRPELHWPEVQMSWLEPGWDPKGSWQSAGSALDSNSVMTGWLGSDQKRFRCLGREYLCCRQNWDLAVRSICWSSLTTLCGRS